DVHAVGKLDDAGTVGFEFPSSLFASEVVVHEIEDRLGSAADDSNLVTSAYVIFNEQVFLERQCRIVELAEHDDLHVTALCMMELILRWSIGSIRRWRGRASSPRCPVGRTQIWIHPGRCPSKKFDRRNSSTSPLCAR